MKKEEMMLLLHDPMAIGLFKEQDEEMQLLAVSLNGLALAHCKEPSMTVKTVAVRNNGFAIKHIDKPDTLLKLDAVEQSPLALGVIPVEERNYSCCHHAVFKNVRAIKYCPEQYQDMTMVELVIRTLPSLACYCRRDYRLRVLAKMTAESRERGCMYA